MAKGGPFATFLIVGPTCFFLGILFASFPYDYYVLWSSPPSNDSLPSLLFRGQRSLETMSSQSISSREPYLNLLETHLRFLNATPPLIARVLHLVIGTGLAGIIAKLYKATEANYLFDGASLVLYICGITVYASNIIRGLKIATDGKYDTPDESTMRAAEAAASGKAKMGEYVGREDSLKVVAASNTILALVLVGILVLQGGQWYAQKKEAAEMEEMDRVADQKKAAREKGASGRGVPGATGAVGSHLPAEDGVEVKKEQ